MKRLQKYVTEQDKQLVFLHTGENVRYYVEAYWDNNCNTFYGLIMRNADTGKALDESLHFTEADIVWAMKDVSKDLRKWKVC